jgi:hypothetical protein
MKYPNIREEELKNKIEQEYFSIFDCTKIIGNIDFCVCKKQGDNAEETESLLWAEAKKGIADSYKSLVQLVLTVGKARTFDKFLPPAFLGAFDAEKIAFIPYNDIQELFYLNDFNWNVTPSKQESKEFKLIYDKIVYILDKNALLYFFEKDDKELRGFIETNFSAPQNNSGKTKIDKNNFIVIYNKWLQTVKPTISVNWEIAKKKNIIDGDFYLADLLSRDNLTLKDKLFVVLNRSKYELNRHEDEYGAFTSSSVFFADGQKAHNQFWNKYERPPLMQYWEYIVERRDLLVPQDVRERKGSFFTPQIWVEMSQKYLADTLGVDWQDEYYVWDCAAGTGNLLTGLTNKYRIWASTIDKQDVDVMHDRINNGANLLESHVFQFDFLNDDFSKLPPALFEIIKDPEKQKKMVIFINPPYAEATTARTIAGTGANKAGVATAYNVSRHFNLKIGNASNEVFALFLAQIYEKIPDAVLGFFSKLKFVQGSNFTKFKEFFLAKYLRGFIVPATSFDNVKGSFPIGFTIWNTAEKQKIQKISCDIYDKKGVAIGKKIFHGNLPESLNKWIKTYTKSSDNRVALMVGCPPDFQHNRQLAILSKAQERYCFNICRHNFLLFMVYFSVRHCIAATWLNDRDQFLFPNKKWEKDQEFVHDCLAFALFHGQNKISCKDEKNHLIPFSEEEVRAKEKFDSDWLFRFMNGKLKTEEYSDLYGSKKLAPSEKLNFSPEARAVFDAARGLWTHYHAQPKVSVNASLYDIREYFQGRNDGGKMKNKSEDAIYADLTAILRDKMNILAQKIEPKVYEYGFLNN